MISRRALLAGLGAGLALPWMGPRLRATEAASPRRLLIVTLPNGMPPAAWRSEGAGLGYTPSPILQGLGAWTDRVTTMEGIRVPVSGGEPHHAARLGVLTGTSSRPWEVVDPAAFRSVDQIAADVLAGAAPLRSLHLSPDAPITCNEAASGQQPTCAGFWTPSWADAATPMIPEHEPSRAMAQVFGEVGQNPIEAARRQRYAEAVLARVRADADVVAGRLAGQSRTRLDQYLAGLLEVERAVQAPATPSTGACAVGRDALLAGHDLNGPMDLPERIAVMSEIAALALQCDRARVVNLCFGSERTDRAAPWLGISESHHHLSHHGGDRDKLAKIEEIGRWEMQEVAALLDRLDATPEGDGSLLDHTLVVIHCAIGDPDQHASNDVPFLLAGGGVPAGGRQVMSGLPVGSFWLSALRHLGVSVDRVGEAETPMEWWV